MSRKLAIAWPARRTDALHNGRLSVPNVEYFSTLVVQNRRPVLTAPNIAEQIVRTIHALTATADWTLLAATVMPDHVHILFSLGTRLSLGRVMGKFKTCTADHSPRSWRWQDDFYAHRLRADESREDFARRVFLNPYRAGLIPVSLTWPWWICPEPERFGFTAHLATTGAPPKEWLREDDGNGRRLPVGE